MKNGTETAFPRAARRHRAAAAIARAKLELQASAITIILCGVSYVALFSDTLSLGMRKGAYSRQSPFA